MENNQNQESSDKELNNKNGKTDTIEIPVPEQAPDPALPTSLPKINASEDQ